MMKLLVATLLLLFSTCLAAWAEGPAPTVLILDSSGSMAAREPDGGTRLDAARKTVADLLGRWPAGSELALMAYGHRRKADCADIETLIGLAPVSAEAIGKQLARLRARGKTPLSQALRQAAALLPGGRGSIVLVSDGIETCNADPCTVAEELRKTHPALTIHVVGFALAEGEAAQLSCIAENAGGRFFDAGDASQLAKPLSTIKDEISATPLQATPELAPAPSAPPPEARISRVELVAVVPGLGKIVDAPVEWSVSEAGRGTFYAGTSRALSLDLAEGRYVIEARAANARATQQVTVTSAEAQSFEIAIDAGRLEIALTANHAVPPFDDLEIAGVKWTLEPLDGQPAAEIPSLARPSLLLASGRYTIRADLNGLSAHASVLVRSGEITTQMLDMRLGTLALEAALDANSPPLDNAAALSWRVGDGAAMQRITGQARPRLTLQEGRYPVILSVSGTDFVSSAEVSAGEQRLERVILPAGELTLAARLGPQTPPLEDWRDTSWTLEPADTLQLAKAMEFHEASPTVPITPGRWRVGLKSGAVSVEREVVVKPGGRTALDIDLAASRLTIRGQPSAGSQAANTVYSIFSRDAPADTAAEPVYEVGSSEGATTILPAGQWRVVASDSDGRTGQADIRLGSGEERDLDIPLE